ncbi:ubiquitin E2 variant, partial [Chytridium lagenaria]
YQNSERTFRDAEAVLLAFNGIIPKMDTFTYDNGTSAVLLCLHGTIPITFRGGTYNIPIACWIPFSYPQHPPMSYVTPTATMLVRMSKHVDLAGKIYHPALAVWHTKPELTLVKLLGLFQEIFSIEPPVYAKP